MEEYRPPAQPSGGMPWYWIVYLVLGALLFFNVLSSGEAAGAFFVLWLFGGGLLALVIWIVVQVGRALNRPAQGREDSHIPRDFDGSRAQAAPSTAESLPHIEGLPRYCSSCGEVFAQDIDNCPGCRAHWPHPLPLTHTQALVVALTEFATARAAGLLDEESYQRLRASYEQRLIASRPARAQRPGVARAFPGTATAPAATAPAAPARAAPVAPARVVPQAGQAVARPAIPPRVAPSRLVAPPAPPKPPRDLGPVIRSWTARRQADLLLYLGAFLLTISAIIFINYRGGSGWVRMSVFTVYTLFFLGLGIGISHWKRVKEAAPVFVALGAILTPLNFVLLWVTLQDTEQQLSTASIWLMGSAATSALYSLLAWRGYGRYYAIPAGIAALVAWGSLAATIEVGWEWFGAWYAVTAAVATSLASYRYQSWRKWLEMAAGLLGFPAVAWSAWAAVLAETEDFTRWQLPVTMAIAAVACVPLSHKFKARESLAPLAPFAAGAAGGAAWAIPLQRVGEVEWLPAWAALAAVGYVLIGMFDGTRARDWSMTAAVVGAASLGAAHASTYYGDEPAVLSATYGLSAVGAVAAWAKWRWIEAGILVPPLAAASGWAALWAADVAGLEWLGVAAAAAGLGYVAFIDIQPRGTQAWRRQALIAGAAGVAAAHIAPFAGEIERWELPATYAVILVAALWDAVLHREERAWLFVPAAVAGGVTSTLWVLEAPREQWAWPALAVAATICATSPWWRRGELLRPAGWAYALALSMAPAFLLPDYFDAPWTGAAALATAGAVWLAAAVMARGDLFSRTQKLKPGTAVELEQRWLSLGAAAWALGAMGYAVRALEWELPEAAWVFAGTAVACWLVVAALGRLAPVLHGILGPAGVASMIVAVASVVPLEAETQIAEMLGAGLLAAALAVRPLGTTATEAQRAESRMWRWRGLALVCGIGSIGFAHAAAVEYGPETWQLPAAYGALVAALLWDALVVRNDWAWLGVPATASAGIVTVLWSQDVAQEHWAWPALGAAAVVELTRFWWIKRPVLRGWGWPYALVLASTPVAAIGPYLDAQWVGSAALLASSGLWFAGALFANGEIARVVSGSAARTAISMERRVLAWGAFAFLHGSLFMAAGALDATRLEMAWSYAAFGLLVWLLVAALARWFPDLHAAAGPSGAFSIALAAVIAGDEAGHSALVLGAATIAAALSAQRPYRRQWQLVTLAAAAGSIASGHVFAAEQGTEAWQMPVAYACAMAALLWNAIVLREDRAWFGVPAIGSFGLGSLLYVLGVEPEHLAWPALGFAAALAASERWWLQRPQLARWGWAYALLLALAPLSLAWRFAGSAPAVGSANLGAAALLWALGAWRAEGKLPASGTSDFRHTRPALGLVSASLVFGATAFFNQAMEWSHTDGAWSFTVLGVIAWLAITAAHNRVRQLNGILFITALAACFVAVAVTPPAGAGQLAANFAIATAGAAQSTYTIRRWAILLLVAAGLAATLAFAWRHFGWDTWTLAAVYGALAVAAAVALTRWRDWGEGERSGVTSALSTLPMALALATSGIALVQRNDTLAAGESLVRTPEWATLTGLVLATGALVSLEGRRLARPMMVRLGTIIGLAGALLGIAMLEPTTNQAYFAPIGLYLVATALITRRSGPFLGPHMDQHEAIMVAGELFIILPAARDALQDGSIGWSLWVLFEGLVLLAAGLAIAQRWLVVGGVLTIGGVAGRFYTSGGFQPPYWVTLGIVGAILVGGGLLLLAAREWWDRTRARLARWWLGDAETGRGRNEPPPASPPAGPAAPAHPGAI